MAHYAELAPRYADVVAVGLYKATRRLEVFPHSGRVLSEQQDEAIREVIWNSYRIVYHVDRNAERVHVLTVIHERQQLPTGLENL